MATVTYGTNQDFSASLYGASHHNTLTFLQNQYESLSNLSSTMGSHMEGFINKAKGAYENFLELESVRRAKAALDRFGSVFQENNIRWLRSEKEVQQAPPAMIPFIMANPVVRQLYQEQRCAGYDEDYVDREPKNIGENHTEYQLAMSGIVTDTEDGSFYSLWDNGETPLTMEEQVAVHSSWDLVNCMIERGKRDPTSKKGGML